MRQTILTAVAQVQPQSADFVRRLLDDLTASCKRTPNPGDQPYDALRSAVPALHLMSMTVVEDDQYDPVFVLEANFDGSAGPFWAQLEAYLGAELREILRRCKRPSDSRGVLFDSVTAPGAVTPLAPLLEALTVFPASQHRGNRGLTRGRIVAEGKLFVALQKAIDTTPALHALQPKDIHQTLRAQLLVSFPWLDEPRSARISLLESLDDWIPVITAAAFGIALLLFRPGWFITFLALASGATLLAWLRLLWLEQHDASLDSPKLDAVALRQMAAGEDHITQNHMISIVHIKPGALRWGLVRLVHAFLNLDLRLFCRNGYLGSMRTIHFAHWAFLDNGGRLMFQSNFDGSWESYLDDFIEKAHTGLTAAWTNGVGFPCTRSLIGGGASEGRKFKAWARHSMTQSQFWFSAYKQYSVNQIERQARLANGLRKRSLRPRDALAWVIDL
jgi:hypothetical protein